MQAVPSTQAIYQYVVKTGGGWFVKPDEGALANDEFYALDKDYPNQFFISTLTTGFAVNYDLRIFASTTNTDTGNNLNIGILFDTYDISTATVTSYDNFFIPSSLAYLSVSTVHLGDNKEATSVFSTLGLSPELVQFNIGNSLPLIVKNIRLGITHQSNATAAPSTFYTPLVPTSLLTSQYGFYNLSEYVPPGDGIHFLSNTINSFQLLVLPYPGGKFGTGNHALTCLQLHLSEGNSAPYMGNPAFTWTMATEFSTTTESPVSTFNVSQSYGTFTYAFPEYFIGVGHLIGDPLDSNFQTLDLLCDFNTNFEASNFTITANYDAFVYNSWKIGYLSTINPFTPASPGVQYDIYLSTLSTDPWFYLEDGTFNTDAVTLDTSRTNHLYINMVSTGFIVGYDMSIIASTQNMIMTSLSSIALGVMFDYTDYATLTPTYSTILWLSSLSSVGLNIDYNVGEMSTIFTSQPVDFYEIPGVTYPCVAGNFRMMIQVTTNPVPTYTQFTEDRGVTLFTNCNYYYPVTQEPGYGTVYVPNSCNTFQFTPIQTYGDPTGYPSPADDLIYGITYQLNISTSSNLPWTNVQYSTVFQQYTGGVGTEVVTEDIFDSAQIIRSKLITVTGVPSTQLYTVSSFKIFVAGVDTNADPFQELIASVNQAITVCFLESTQIATPSGPELIQNLKVGDEVAAHTGERVKVSKVWTNTLRWNDDFVNVPLCDRMFKVPAGTCGAKLDTFVSYYHMIEGPRGWKRAGESGLPEATRAELCGPEGYTFTLCHIEVEEHEKHRLIVNGGLIAEAWDGIDRVPRPMTLKFGEEDHITIPFQEFARKWPGLFPAAH